MNYFVYLIATRYKNKTISYVGYTSNLTERLSKHNIGKGAKFTRGRKWKLIYKKRFETKSLAMREEYKLKKDYKLRFIIKNKFFKNA